MLLQLHWTSPQHGSKGFTLPALLGDKGKLSHLIYGLTWWKLIHKKCVKWGICSLKYFFKTHHLTSSKSTSFSCFYFKILPGILLSIALSCIDLCWGFYLSFKSRINASCILESRKEKNQGLTLFQCNQWFSIKIINIQHNLWHTFVHYHNPVWLFLNPFYFPWVVFKSFKYCFKFWSSKNHAWNKMKIGRIHFLA